MLNLEKTYTVKSNATADIRKAVSRNQCAEGEYEARKVDGGFQIFKTVAEPPETVMDSTEVVIDTPETVIENTPEPITPANETPATDNAPETTTTAISDRQLAVLNALLGVKTLEDKAINERAGEWVPFADLNDSNNPHNLPAPALPGITGALKRKNLVETAWGKDWEGKRSVIITITAAGISTLQAA
jgi:hypothetical protein